MTAFAAIFSRDGDAIDSEGSDRVAASLASIAGRAPSIADAGPCRLLLAPLHQWTHRAALVPHDTGVTAAGQVTLEAADDLRRAMDLAAGASDLDITAATLARRGADGVRHLHGEYSFAAWHHHDGALICARDGLGIRVLYIGESDDVVVVSNTIGAVLAHPAIARTLDEGALVRFLAHGSVTTGTATPYRAVKLLPEGHTLLLRPGHEAILQRHWQPPAPERHLSAGDRSVPEGYRDVLHRAVADRLAGKRATIFLSGGLDSTTIAAAAVECAAELQAVTFRYRTVDTADETLAADAARHLGIRRILVEADAHLALEAERRGETSAALVDEPGLANWRDGLARAAQFSTLAAYGEDGDALLSPPGGAALLAAQSLSSAALASVKLLARDGEMPYLGLRLRDRIGWSHPPRPEPTPWLTQDASRLVEQDDAPSILGARPQPLEFDAAGGRVWARLLRNVPRDFAVSLSPDVTRQRLELTLPLMDTRVIRYVLSIPPIPWCHRKRVAREAFAGHLPAAILQRPKTPLAGAHEALVGAWRREHDRLARDPESAALVAQYRWIDPVLWRQTIAEGSATAAMAAWRVLMLNAWLLQSAGASTACTR